MTLKRSHRMTMRTGIKTPCAFTHIRSGFRIFCIYFLSIERDKRISVLREPRRNRFSQLQMTWCFFQNGL